MPRVTKTITVPAAGVGRPDYAGEQWQVKTIPKYELHGDELVKYFGLTASTYPSAFSYVVAPIAPAVPTKAVDVDTGLPTPFNVPLGYELEIVEGRATWNQPVRMTIFLNIAGTGDSLDNEFYLAANTMWFEAAFITLSTKSVDPTFKTLISMTGMVENLGAGDMRGYFACDCILRAHHTEKLTRKTVRCKYCGCEQLVPYATTKINCSKCGRLNLYFR